MRLTTESSSVHLPQTDISALQTTVRKIRGFAQLKTGWHYGEGIPFEQSILNNAIALNREAIRSGFLETDTFPGLNGEVVLAIYFADHYLEFIIEPNGSITFYYEKGDEEIAYQEGLPLQDAKEKIRQFRAEKWIASDSLTGRITTTPEGLDLTVSPLGIPDATTPESRSLIQSAYSMAEEVSANISAYFIEQLQMTPPSTGVSRQTYYLTVSG